MKMYNLCLLALSILQLICCKIAAAESFPAAANHADLSRLKFLEFYNKGLSLLAKDYSEKAKLFSESILKEFDLQSKSSPEFEEFKQNITTFLERYNFYQRHGLYTDLLKMFSDMTIEYYYQSSSHNITTRNILSLFKKLDLDKINNEYEENFIKFIKEKFLTKFETSKTQLIMEKPELLSWFESLKKCQDYNCYYLQFYEFPQVINTPKELLVDFITSHRENIFLYNVIGLNHLAHLVLKDLMLSPLNNDLSYNLTHNLKEFITKVDNNHNISKLYEIISIFNHNITNKFYNNLNIKKIFNNHGYQVFEEYNTLLLNKFIQHDLNLKFEKFKKSLNTQELEQEENLFKWFEELKTLLTYVENFKILEKLQHLKKL